MGFRRRNRGRANNSRNRPRGENRRVERASWRVDLRTIGDRLTGYAMAVAWSLGRALPYVVVAVVMALVPIAVAYGYRYLTEAPSFAVQHVQVHGHSQVGVEEVLKTAGVDRSPNLLALDLEEVERRLVDHPWILTARVVRELPDRLEIQISERVPVALIALGSLYLVDVRGAIFKRVEAGEHWDFPVMTGLSAEDVASGAPNERQRSARTMIRGGLKVLELWESTGLHARSEISEIVLDPLFGYSLVLGKGLDVGVGTMVRLGTNGLRQKMLKVETVLADAERRGAQVAEIRVDDERDSNRVAVRFRDKERVRGQSGVPNDKETKNERNSGGSGMEANPSEHLARQIRR